MQRLYPIALDLTDRRILIVGGGAVAARKARGVLEAGATQVRVVALEIVPEMPAGVRREKRAFVESDLEGVELCFAATDSMDVNAAVVEACRARGIWVNRADREGSAEGDFTVPAVYRAGPLTIAVSAAGSPAIAAAVRTEITGKLDPIWANFAEVAAEFRKRVHAVSSLGAPERQAVMRDLSTPEALAVFRAEGTGALWSFLRERHPELPAEEVGHGD